MRALVAALLLVFMGCEARDAVGTDPFACTGAGDCSAGFGCLIDRCVPQAQLVCEADGDCPSPWVCEAGRCAAPRGGRCQPEAGTCPDGFSCTDGRCARDAECRDDVDCGEGSVCGPGQVCVGCVVDGDCPPGERCELGRCKPQAGCADDSDCEGDLACRDGECVPLACADVADCPDAMTWGCFEGVCLRRECEDGALCEGGAFCRDGQCTDCVATAECREQGRAGWQCWDGFCLPPCDPLSACCGEDGDGNRVRLAECEASAQVRCAHRPEFVCDRQQVKESFEGTCALDPAAPEQRMVCEYDPERSPVLVEPTGECNAAADLFCVEDDAGNADCGTRRECDCDAQRDHTPCLLGEGRCVVEMCRGWRCDEAECNSRGPWFAFPFVERLDPLEPLPNQDAHVIRGEPYMDVEWAFPGLEIRKASQWDAHTHCADLGVGVAGADTDWRLPTLHELITLTQRDYEVEDLELPAISRTVFNDAAMVVYFGEPPDGGPRVRPVPLENPDRQRFWPVCVRPAFQPAAADLPPLRRGLDANGGLRDGVDEWTGASWTQAGEVATFALARQACNEAGARLPTVSEVYSLLDFHPRPDGVGLPVDVLTGRPQLMGVRVWAGLPGDGVAQVDLGSGEVFAADDALPRAEARCVQAPCQDDLDCLGAQVCDGGWCAPDDANPEDPDGDGVEGVFDNCPEDPNPDQTDTDSDGQGDACDECPRAARHDDPCCNGGEWAPDGAVVDVGQPRQVCEGGGGCGSAVLEIVSQCECQGGASLDCFEEQRELVDCDAQWCDPQTLDCRFIAACAEAEAVDCAEADEHTPCVVPGQPNKPARCVVGQCCGFDRADAACNELGPGFTQPLRAQGLQLLPLGGAVFADEGTGLVWHDSGVDAWTTAALHRACAEVRLDADNDGEADRWRLPTFLELLTLAPTDLVNLPGLFGNNRTFASRTMLGAGFYAVDLADLRSLVINDNMASAGALCVLVDEPAETHPRPRTFELIGDGVYEDPWTGWRVKEADIGDSRAQAAIACNEQGLGGEAWRLPKAKDVGLLMRYHQAPAYTVSGQPEPDTRVWLDELRVAGLAPGDRLLNLESGQIEWASGRPAAIRCVAPPVPEGGQ